MNHVGAWPALLGALLRATPAGWPGKARLARWALGNALQTPDVVLRTRWGDLALPHLREPIAFYLLIDGVYERDGVRLLRRQLAPGGSFVDVGANVGALTLVAARLAGPGGRVLAAEASGRLFAYLAGNVRRNRLGNVLLRRCAVQDRDGGRRDFYDAPPRHFGMGSLAPQFGRAPAAVPARTLDSLLGEAGFGRVDLLKVDVEGYEASVFRGAAGLLGGPRPPLLLFEFCDWAEARAGFPAGEAQEVLLGHGYRLARLADWLRGRPPLAGPVRSGTAQLVGLPPGRPQPTAP